MIINGQPEALFVSSVISIVVQVWRLITDSLTFKSCDYFNNLGKLSASSCQHQCPSATVLILLFHRSSTTKTPHSLSIVLFFSRSGELLSFFLSDLATAP